LAERIAHEFDFNDIGYLRRLCMTVVVHKYLDTGFIDIIGID
jgi:hypothetical protein